MILNIIYGLAMAFAIYSKIPMPNIEWKEQNMKYVMCFFPLVGIVHGILWSLWWLICSRITGVIMFRVLTCSALPFLLDGGIHFDGYLDVCDALHSYGDKNKKLSILKDPHIGAFAVIYGIIYILIWVSAVSLIDENDIILCMLVFCIIRALSAITFVKFKGAKNEGMQFTISKSSEDIPVQITSVLYLTVCFVLLIYISPLTAIAILITALILTILYHHMAFKNFGGITGDTAGWFLQITMLAMFLCIGLI